MGLGRGAERSLDLAGRRGGIEEDDDRGGGAGERERTLELREGVAGADKEIQLEPRAEPKDQSTT